MSVREPKIVSSVSEIADKIRFARVDEKSLGKTVFFVGAGCSITAGIPGAADIAKRMVREVAGRFGCSGADLMETFTAVRLRIKQIQLVS
jgi:hypothetical protein